MAFRTAVSGGLEDGGAHGSGPLKQTTERTLERPHASVLFPNPNPGQSVSASSSPVHVAPATQNGILLSSREFAALCRQIYRHTCLPSRMCSLLISADCMRSAGFQVGLLRFDGI